MVPRAILLATLVCLIEVPSGRCLADDSVVGPVPQAVRALLSRYCFDCHGESDPDGDLSLTRICNSVDVRAGRESWRRVWEVLHTQQMPPEDPAPTPEERRRLMTAVATLLSRGGADSGQVVMRRLNQAEYNNTIYDLFGVYRRTISSGGTQYDPSRGMPEQVRVVEHRDVRQTVVVLPPDDVGYGFTNIGEVLSLPPFLLERYLQASQHVVEQLMSGGEARTRRRPGDSAELPDPQESARQFVENFSRRALGKRLDGSRIDRDPRERAREFIAAFGRRAFRRPMAGGEIERYLTLYETATEQGEPFEMALKAPLQAMLVSPNFLFRVEHGVETAERDGLRPLSDDELATRLSYFLWSTMPDEELFRLADAGRLRDPDALEEQARRMLRHRFSKELGQQFGMQWLQVSGIRSAMPFPDLYPEFYRMKYLPEAMQDEALLLFETILIEDRSVFDFLDPGFTWLNGTLFEFYGLDSTGLAAPSRQFFERYALPDKRRGGILTMAGPLLATSLATRTSPVNRGKWVLETVLGAPPPPPPGNVPDLDNTPVAEEHLSLRERLERHSADPACASCHRRMDPLGVGLENYDAIGAWRERDGDQPIDAAGALGDDADFNGPVELKEFLMTRYREDFRYCLTEKMLTYALGRKLEPTDTVAVSEIVERLKQNDDRFSELVVGIVRSEPFRFLPVAAESDQESPQ